MMAKISKRIYPPGLVLLCASLACSLLSPPTPAAPSPTFDVDAISTYIALTAQNALTLSAVPMPSITSAPTSTLFPTQTGTPTPDYTFTPAVPIISVSTNTNCRSGPGKVYDYEGALLVGDVAEIFARDPTGKYWYIRNPDHPKRYCWVWDEYAAVSGNVAFLPVYTPPPTPTPTSTPTPTNTPIPAPSFQVSYTGMDTCVGWWLEFKIKNTGHVPLKSVQVELLDRTAGKLATNITDGFTDINGCLSTTIRDTLSSGASAIVSSAAFTFDPTGHVIVATITVCSKIGLSGLCAAKKIRFSP